MLFIAAVLIGSFVILAAPSANALTTKDCSSGYVQCYSNPTARLGNTSVCGDHICAPGEWDKLQASISAAQLGYQGGRSTTQTSTGNTTSASPTTSLPTTATPNVCDSIKSMLSSGGVSSSVVSKVMSDLGCS